MHSCETWTVDGRWNLIAVWLVLGVSLAGCGGGGGGTTTPATYAVGGSVTGLSGNGLVLRNSGGNDLNIAGNGSFAFTTRLASGAAYAVTVASQPGGPTQSCVVTNGTGSVGSADVSNVSVMCTTSSFTVGGTVTGLNAGSSVVVQNNLGDNLTITANGSFLFPASILSGAAYSVAILTNTIGPARRCQVSGGSGTIGGGNIANVAILCPGKHAYVVNNLGNEDRLTKYQIGATGALSSISVSASVANNAEPTSVAILPSGEYIYTAHKGTREIARFWNDPNDNTEDLVVGATYLMSSVTAEPSIVVMHPFGQFLYVADTSSADTIQAFQIDATTGGLTPVGPAYSVPTLEGMVIDATGTFLLATSYGNHTVTAFRVNAATGALTISPNPPRSTGLIASEQPMAIDPMGRFAFVAHFRELTVLSFAIDAATGDLSAPVSTVTMPDNVPLGATPLIVDPTGRFLYCGITDGTMHGYAINQTTGGLTPIAGSPFTTSAASGIAPGPVALSVDPSGQFVYVVNSYTNTILQMLINRSTGVLTEITPMFTSFEGPAAMAIF